MPASSRLVFGVFARPRTHPGGLELIALYSTPERAQRFIDAQDESVHMVLSIVEIVIDSPPSGDLWKRPTEDPVLPADPTDLQDRLAKYGRHLERLAEGDEYALVCGGCGRAVSYLANYVERSVLSHTRFPGTCSVCGRVGSVSPSGDWIDEGD